MTRITIPAVAVFALAITTAAGAAAPRPAVSLLEGRATAKSAMIHVQRETPGATASGVSRCAHPKIGGKRVAYFVDCKGWVKRSRKPICRLQVRVKHNQDGLVWTFQGRSTCSGSGSGLASPGTPVY